MELAPILLFTYNRPEHTRNTIEALQKNLLAADSDLYIFSDAPKTPEAAGQVRTVRDYCKTISGFKSVQIIERQQNFGLGKNIIDGVKRIIDQRGRVIVLEDDLLTSPYFLQFINQGLNLYEHDREVASIHGYLYPVKSSMPETFFIRNADCLGWGTWRRAWDIFQPDGNILLEHLTGSGQIKTFDFGGVYPFTQMLRDQIAGKNSSWAIRWYASAFLNNMYTLYPGRSLVYHAGNDGTGENSGFDSLLNVELSQKQVAVSRIDIRQDPIAYDAFAKFYKLLAHPPLLQRVKRKLKKILAG